MAALGCVAYTAALQSRMSLWYGLPRGTRGLLGFYLGVVDNLGHGTKCDALSIGGLRSVLRYDIQVPNSRRFV